MTIKLDGVLMTDRTVAHKYIKSTFNFPEYYGNNLDALFDLLTEYQSPLNIEIFNKSVIKDNLGDYGNMLIDTFLNAAQENTFIKIELI